ncbi:putative glycosyltransferase EpsJ [Paenibacillus konkukensis]|uniref:Glycosyltransferase EpsJ n=1 Tax=Paenibacillus konkukensis TaxID=2020716 RepID=A0ABY4RSX7_9BACL|nr:glycosyltransferase [Paenibacillus konkukensis]UQZ85686.1 putative glycosyltransferase EpsJ [Paenibacillus konkukensis]
MKAKVSVIIPVYNAERYLAECIESLMKQSLQECEFLFIDDGSTDRSAGLIETYAGQDRRIQLIRQDNQGVSAARNTGLRVASGEYVGFVDADDYIEPDMMAVLYEAAGQYAGDVVISNFESEIEGHWVQTSYPFLTNRLLDREFVRKEILPYFLRSDQLNSVWNKLYRNQLIQDCGAAFPDKVALGEDGIFNMRVFCHASNAVYLDYCGYHYREVDGSATRNIIGKDYFQRALEVYLTDVPEMKAIPLSREEIRKLKAVRLVHSVMSYVYLYFQAAQKVSFKARFAYVSRMIANPHVQEALAFYADEKAGKLGRYDRWLLEAIRGRSAISLYCITSYSKLRSAANK